MITGAHTILYSTNPEADRVFFRDVLHLTNVDAGEGWLIFGLPPSEVAIHPSDHGGRQELYLICDDIKKLIHEMSARGVSCSPIQDQSWGQLTRITLPSGSQMGVYQPNHPRP